MNKAILKAIHNRDQVLKESEACFRKLKEKIEMELFEANQKVFPDSLEAAKANTQAQVFQLLQDRLTEVGTECSAVYRY